MKREMISGELMWKSELKDVYIKNEENENEKSRVKVIDFSIRENKVLKNITAWGEKAETIASIPKNSLILASCYKKVVELPKENENDFTKYKEHFICEKIIEDKELVTEIIKQYDQMLKDFNQGKIESIYISKEQQMYESEKEEEKISENEKEQMQKKIEEEYER